MSATNGPLSGEQLALTSRVQPVQCSTQRDNGKTPMRKRPTEETRQSGWEGEGYRKLKTKALTNLVLAATEVGVCKGEILL